MKITTLLKNGMWGIATAALVLAAGCATKKPASKNYIVFPQPPDETRIQYLMSFGSEDELGTNTSFSTFLLGPKLFHAIWKPYGVAARKGKIYVCDSQGGCITVTDVQRKKMHYISPNGQAAMRLPVGIAVDADESIYVTDTGREQVLVYDKKENLVEVLGKIGEMKPCGIALSADRFYVTDLKHANVRVYSKTNFQLLFTFPKDNADEKSRLFQPTNLAVDQNGNICVSDTAGFCVKIFDAEGKHLRTVGDMGIRPGEFALPKGIAVDHESRIYVVDAAAPVVQIFDSEGRLLLYFGDPQNSGEAGLYLPATISIDYDSAGLFKDYVAPGYALEYVILLTNQAGPHKVSVFGFLKRTST